MQVVKQDNHFSPTANTNQTSISNDPVNSIYGLAVPKSLSSCVGIIGNCFTNALLPRKLNNNEGTISLENQNTLVENKSFLSKAIETIKNIFTQPISVTISNIIKTANEYLISFKNTFDHIYKRDSIQQTNSKSIGNILLDIFSNLSDNKVKNHHLANNIPVNNESLKYTRNNNREALFEILGKTNCGYGILTPIAAGAIAEGIRTGSITPCEIQKLKLLPYLPSDKLRTIDLA